MLATFCAGRADFTNIFLDGPRIASIDLEDIYGLLYRGQGRRAEIPVAYAVMPDLRWRRRISIVERYKRLTISS